MIDRRRFLLTSVAGALGWPLGGEAQQAGKPARIGRLSGLSADADAPFMNAFRQGMRDLGWIEGQGFTLVSRFAEGKADRLPQIAAALVRDGVDVIVSGSSPGALAAKNATTRVPIVIVTTGDPIADGIVASLAHPGGNVTGLTALGGVLTSKRLEVLKEALPGLKHVAVLVNPISPYATAFLKERDEIARELRLELRVLSARTGGELPGAFGALTRERAEAIMVISDVMFATERRAIVDLVERHRAPAIYFDRAFVNAGGLMFYGASLVDMYRRAATYVDRVLKGARPADLPIEQPTKFELVINLKTARALGLTIPPSLLARADQVIE
jgi:putative ABC transport system substrate-binding protein